MIQIKPIENVNLKLIPDEAGEVGQVDGAESVIWPSSLSDSGF